MPEQESIDKNRNKGKPFAIISIIIFMASLVLPSVIWIFMHIVGRDVVQALDYDLGENRNKASFPESISVAFMGEVEEYYNDRLPFRSVIISANRKLSSVLERPFDKVIESEEYLAPKVYNSATIEGRDKWLFFALENSLEDYLGSNVLSQEEMDAYLNSMEKLNEICENQGKKLFFIMPPNKEQVYSEFMPSYSIVDHYKKAQRLVDYVHKNSDIEMIYPIEELKAEKEQWQLYLKTDTHWNSAGAFVGVQALYELMGMSTTNLESLEISEEKIYNGDLLGMGNLNWEDFAGDKTYIVEYRPDVNVVMELGTGYGADIYSATSTSGNPCDFVLVGDSFRINMGQFLSKDFDKCTLINVFSVNNPDAICAIENADVIVIELVERNSVNFPSVLANVCEILES